MLLCSLLKRGLIIISIFAVRLRPISALHISYKNGKSQLQQQLQTHVDCIQLLLPLCCCRRQMRVAAADAVVAAAVADAAAAVSHQRSSVKFDISAIHFQQLIFCQSLNLSVRPSVPQIFTDVYFDLCASLVENVTPLAWHFSDFSVLLIGFTMETLQLAHFGKIKWLFVKFLNFRLGLLYSIQVSFQIANSNCNINNLSSSSTTRYRLPSQ